MKLGSGREMKVATIVGIALACVLIAGLTYAEFNGSTGGPSIIIAKWIGNNNPQLVLGISLPNVMSSQKGYQQDASVNFSEVPPTTDTGHLEVTLSEGAYQNGSKALIVTLTDIGQSQVTVGRLTFGGVSSSGTNTFESYVIGDCIQNSTDVLPVVSVFNYANATVTGTTTITEVSTVTPASNSTSATVTTFTVASAFTSVSELFSTTTNMQTFHVVCGTPALRGPITLLPGQSGSAYLVLSPNILKNTVQVGVGATYTVTDNSTGYQIVDTANLNG